MPCPYAYTQQPSALPARKASQDDGTRRAAHGTARGTRHGARHTARHGGDASRGVRTRSGRSTGGAESRYPRARFRIMGPQSTMREDSSSREAFHGLRGFAPAQPPYLDDFGSNVQPQII